MNNINVKVEVINSLKDKYQSYKNDALTNKQKDEELNMSIIKFCNEVLETLTDKTSCFYDSEFINDEEFNKYMKMLNNVKDMNHLEEVAEEYAQELEDVKNMYESCEDCLQDNLTIKNFLDISTTINN